ncbi:hypothetical protein CUJ89_10755 [Burkholderia pyrrocinia]|uniref:Uncharacterized protein n=1 Tax=Burkholderia pyrrocinia TaxID=60550 RepID=A0A2Z5MUM2_BURPY|nr:hypothetical protein [Burkholderia pyrrocinia]AXF20921.1 hypothetical protein CUJ89_10755 [Burkholderia pyrrocinia]
MNKTISMPIAVLALTLAIPAFSATPADNVAWSARPVQVAASSTECSAYSRLVFLSDKPLSTEAVLKSVGTMLAVSALSFTGGSQGIGPIHVRKPACE